MLRPHPPPTSPGGSRSCATAISHRPPPAIGRNKLRPSRMESRRLGGETQCAPACPLHRPKHRHLRTTAGSTVLLSFTPRRFHVFPVLPPIGIVPVVVRFFLLPLIRVVKLILHSGVPFDPLFAPPPRILHTILQKSCHPHHGRANWESRHLGGALGQRASCPLRQRRDRNRLRPAASLAVGRNKLRPSRMGSRHLGGATQRAPSAPHREGRSLLRPKRKRSWCREAESNDP